MQEFLLNNGVAMPAQGYGVFHITDKKQCRECVLRALETGYRMIDTAASYHNEDAVGDAVRACGIPRKELFISTKLWVQDSGYENTMKAFHASLKRLGLDYLDLYLIHHPFGDYYGSWRAMSRLLEEGLVRAIGVCNFSPDRLIDLCMNQEIKPAVNQLELHPFHQQEEALRVMKRYGVIPQAWGPLAEGQRNIFCNGILQKIAKKHERTTAQVILRWNLQRGISVIPKTVHPERMVENLRVWDFELTDSDMREIKKLDVGHSEIIDHHCWCTARQLNEIKIHE
ncbi:MAG: aldo/keto reductase [Eubacteriales bacterium]|nr:aldo/keto reductase [Eubacteriales bacterium]